MSVRANHWLVAAAIAALILGAILTLGTWVGVRPQPRRIPAHLVVLGVVWLALAGLGRLRLPRWSLVVVVGVLALVGVPLGLVMGNFLFVTLMCTVGISTLLLLPGTLVGRIAARGGTETWLWPSLRVMSSANSCHCSTEE